MLAGCALAAATAAASAQVMPPPQNVLQLQEELTTTENKIAFARQFYNDSVMGLNTSIESFPANLIARQFGFTPAAYFEVPEAETAAPKVDLR